MAFLKEKTYLVAMILVVAFGFAASRTIYRFGPTHKFGESVCNGVNELIDLIGIRMTALSNRH